MSTTTWEGIYDSIEGLINVGKMVCEKMWLRFKEFANLFEFSCFGSYQWGTFAPTSFGTSGKAVWWFERVDPTNQLADSARNWEMDEISSCFNSSDKGVH